MRRGPATAARIGGPSGQASLLERIAHAEHRRKLLKDSARGSVGGGRDLALGECVR